MAHLIIKLAAVAIFLLAGSPLQAQTTEKLPRHRLIVLTDIKADPDDEQSLVRLVLYANELDEERPLWISVWGGVNTLVQALYTIRETYSEREAAQLIGKLRVYTISDQDDSGAWLDPPVDMGWAVNQPAVYFQL